MVSFAQAHCLVTKKRPTMRTFDTMHSLGLLTREQYAEITCVLARRG